MLRALKGGVVSSLLLWKGSRNYLYGLSRNTLPDSEGNHCGSVLLSKGGLLTGLEDQVFTCEFSFECVVYQLLILDLVINSYRLDRTQDTKFYYSELELKLVVQEYIKMSNKSSRLATLQKLCIGLTSCSIPLYTQDPLDLRTTNMKFRAK